MEKDIMKIMDKIYIDYLNNLSKYAKAIIVAKYKLKLDHYGEIKYGK